MARFRTSARTVDMLGRQQIAGVPTAISELFKNAHDAYAQAAIADFIRYEDLFVIRDDGVGMTREQFEQRWLTLGTASKASVGRRQPPPPGMPPRAVLGEKGIGRLAIAAIGPQTLVLTRPRAEEGIGLLTVALLHWGAFELLHADLADVVIPIKECQPGESPDVWTMAEEIRDNVKSLAGPEDEDLVRKITSDLKRWKDLDLAQIAQTVADDDLVGESGTCFVIAPTSPDLEADLRAPAPKEAPPLLKTLIGFANTMTPGHSEPELHTSFRDHRVQDDVRDLIEEGEFFTPEEFMAADHHFKGRFDEYGQFEGEVTVFGGEPVRYPVAWTGARGVPTRCGPFDLNMAYIQGLQRESGLEPTEYHRMVEKLDHYGGLYIYRDGTRVLPYGDNRFDWLDVELRRTKSASDNFFSYRRMFGAVEISREHNSQLREKAGREGFATNEPYRQFRAILEQFFVQVAAEFFREGGSRSDAYDEGRLANDRLKKARVARSGHVRVRRKELRNQLERFFAQIDTGEPEARAERILGTLEVEVDRALKNPDPGEAARRLATAESEARHAIRTLDSDLEVRRPRGVSLSSELARDVRSYERQRAETRDSVLMPLEADIERIVTAAGDERQAAVQRRVRFDEALHGVALDGRNELKDSRRELSRATDETRTRSGELARSSTTRVEDEVQGVLAQASSLDVTSMSDDEFVAQRTALEERVRLVAVEHAQALQSVSEQLQAIAWPVNGDGPLVTAADQVEELETRLEAFLERSEQDLELTQIGLAVEIINHEFQTSVKSIRDNLRRLKGWADSNPELRSLYRDLRGAFDHLDGYLKLFTPLHRRLYRNEVDISGRQLERFVRDVFAERLEQQEIELEATEEFEAFSVRKYPSTLYPVFVNLLDNAVYWLTDYRGNRRISLEVDGADLLVTDSGPGIPERDREAVFELGFSRKIGGTGYGLYIAREVLNREGMKLTLDPGSPDRGARFRITTDTEGSENE